MKRAHNKKPVTISLTHKILVLSVTMLGMRSRRERAGFFIDQSGEDRVRNLRRLDRRITIWISCPMLKRNDNDNMTRTPR
jgi:hypothetical protein